MKNYQLYARILRLSHLVHPSMSLEAIADMDRIVRDHIILDSQLVWC